MVDLTEIEALKASLRGLVESMLRRRGKIAEPVAAEGSGGLEE